MTGAFSGDNVMLEVRHHLRQKRVELSIVQNKIIVGSINFSVEQAEHHARTVMEAVRLIRQQRGTILLPGDPGYKAN